DLEGFYDRVADMDVDRVYLGEVVCARKRLFGGLGPGRMEAIASKLERAGKKVVLSSLAVVSNEEELEATRQLCALGRPVEANDMSVFNIVDPREREVTAGPHITSYNVPSVEFLAGVGVGRVVLPVELPGESIRYMAAHSGLATEVFSHGKAPLAFSWRCYTSRAYGLDKTDCRHDCARFPDGMVVSTTEGTPVFTINGTSVLSAGTYTLVEFTDQLARAGVAAMRISPQPEGTGEVVRIFRQRLAGAISAEEALEGVERVSPGPVYNGWYMAGAGRDFVPRAG
ncbi:MAG: U32 family peptidase, partial [Thermodesulfobacteriota bacterium]